MASELFATTPLSEVLRSERLRRGLTVAEIAAATRIPRHHIEAIEEGQFDSLPSGAYRFSFVRQYASMLGFNDQDIAISFHQQYQEMPLPLPKPPNKRRSVSANLVWLPVAALALAGLHQLWRTERSAQPKTTHRAAMVPAPIGNAERLQEESPEKPASESTAATDEKSGIRVELSADEQVWILIKCDGVEAYSGIIGAAQVKQFEANSKITALVGNAGGLKYSINGKTSGPLGAHGEVELLEFTTAGARVLNRRTTKPSAAEEELQQDR